MYISPKSNRMHKTTLIVILSLALAFNPSFDALAVPDEDFYSDSEIQIYNPNACAPGVSSGANANDPELLKILQSSTEGAGAGSSISVLPLDSSVGSTTSVSGTKQMPTRSSYKIYTAYATLRAIEAGKISWSSSVSKRGNNPGNFSSGTVEKAMEMMIVQSDNAAASALRLNPTIGNPEKVTSMLRNDIGLSSKTIVGSGSASAPKGSNSQSTSSDFVKFLYKLHKKDLLGIKDDANYEKLQGFMERATTDGASARSGIAKGVGSSAKVYDKPGWGNDATNDVGIVALDSSPYAVAILTPNGSSNWSFISSVAKKINDHMKTSGSGASDAASQYCCTESSDSVSTSLPASIPKYWRDLINNAAPKHKDSDPRLVAAVLWAENRGWPNPKKDWSTSHAGAQGPWQFIPGTWASMGQDGDNDGKKDPNNPKDAVHAAFIHHKGSKGKTLVEGFTGTAQSYFKQAKFKRDRKNLLSFAASYNGSGAPDNTLLKNFPKGDENSDYVIMVYWLIGTNFEKGWMPHLNKLVNASTTSGSSGHFEESSGCSSSGGATRVVEVAKQQYQKNKGFREYDGDIKKYTTGRKEPWCADFVSWVYKTADSPFRDGGEGGWQYPSVVILKDYFDKKHEFFKPGEKVPEPGDVAFYIGADTPDGGSAQHVNIVIEVKGDKMITIGGNESDQIMKSERNIKLGAQSLAGFGRYKN